MGLVGSMHTNAGGRRRRTRASSVLCGAVFGAVSSYACGPSPDPVVESFSGSAGADFGGSAGTGGVAGTGAQGPCPPEPSGLVPGCANGLIDADRDGYGDPGRPHECCGGDGTIPPLTDCDDTDETRALIAYSDGDGDGRGAGNPVCSTDPPPSGFSFSSGDCDDENPSIDWAGSSDCGCERFLFDTVVPANPDCASAPDLHVIDHAACDMNCGQWLAFRVGNAGGAVAQGPIQVSVTVRSEQATLELETLGHGEASGWLKVPFLGFTGPATITIVSPRGDCPALRPSFETELVMSCSP